jgi:hypothetical protein
MTRGSLDIAWARCSAKGEEGVERMKEPIKTRTFGCHYPNVLIIQSRARHIRGCGGRGHGGSHRKRLRPKEVLEVEKWEGSREGSRAEASEVSEVAEPHLEYGLLARMQSLGPRVAVVM